MEGVREMASWKSVCLLMGRAESHSQFSLLVTIGEFEPRVIRYDFLTKARRYFIVESDFK